MGWNLALPKARWVDAYTPDLASIIDDVLEQPYVAIDTETTGLNRTVDVPLYFSMAWGQNRLCLPIAVAHLFSESFKDSTKLWIFANAKFDMHMFANIGITFAGDVADVAVMHALLKEESPHDLKGMSAQELGWTWQGFTEVFPGHKESDTGTVLQETERTNRDKLVEYAANDAWATLQLFEHLRDLLMQAETYSGYPDRYQTMWDIFFLDEVPTTKVLWGMERKGIFCDPEYLKSLEVPIAAEIKQVERDLVRERGKPFNPNSPDQLRTWLIEERGLKPFKSTKGGKTGNKKPSTDSDFLQFYADQGDAACKLLMRNRDLAKVQGTYVLGLQQRLDPQGRVHTKFNQDTARTGRLSSSDPNLQNIKRPDEDEFKLRKAFRAPAGKKLIVGDYEQLEMRLLAAASQEADMIQIFLDGKDIHMGNAALVFGPLYQQAYNWAMTYDDIVEAKNLEKKIKTGKLPPESMTRNAELALLARQRAKAIGFGLNYGMKEKKLAGSLGCSVEEAKELIQAYLARYPAVSAFYASQIEETRLTGFSHTFIGRRRFHPEILSDIAFQAWGAERQCVNNVIQGTAADVVRHAMLRCYEAKLSERYGAELILQVHDELIFEAPEDTAEAAKEEIRHLMEHSLPLINGKDPFLVPLAVSIATGDNWMECH